MVGNTPAATEWQCPVRSCQRPIVQGATTGSPCAQFARRIVRCDAALGARRSDDGRERSRRKEKCLHAVDYSVEGRPTDKVKACATTDQRGRRSAELMIRLKLDGHMLIQDKNGIWTV